MHDLRRGRQYSTVNDLLVKLLPLFWKLCLEVTDVTNACAMHPLLHYAIAGDHIGSK